MGGKITIQKLLENTARAASEVERNLIVHFVRRKAMRAVSSTVRRALGALAVDIEAKTHLPEEHR